MPRVSFFRGIVILMFANEGQHAEAHFHARYAEHSASVALDGSVIAGSLPAPQLRLVQEWAAAHEAELEPIGSDFGTGKRSSRSSRSPKIVGMTATRPLWDVTGVAVIGDHKLRLLFEDGTVGDVSFDDDHWTGVFEPLRDPKRFAKVTIKYGTLYWPHDELDMAPEPLYEAARQNPVTSTMASPGAPEPGPTRT